MKTWKILERKTILNHNKFLRVESHVVRLPDGQIIDDWSWVVTPDYVNVVVEREDGRFLIFRQYKYGVGGVSLAPVGGYIEPDEDPLTAAKRELLEETGYEAKEWVDLGRYSVDGNRGAGMAYLFLAREARQITEPNADDLEEQELLLLNRDEMATAVSNGEFKVLSWATAVVLALRYLD
jgi:ADP-ribose pyrophosphatase